jgi:hypothetical protein
MISRARITLVALLALGALAGLPAGARADADPPSDILLLQDVYVPFQPKVSVTLEQQLTALAAQAKKAGFPIKVAIVGSALDLGGVPAYFGKPQQYAQFLYSEITQPTGKQTLLVVMPAGIGLVSPPSGGANAISGLKVPPNAKSDQLATIALQAVRKLAAAAGHPVSGGGGSSSPRSSSTSPLLIFGLPVLLVAAAAVFLRLRSRGEDDDDAEVPGHEPGSGA